mgnify:CR=1 FL=1
MAGYLLAPPETSELDTRGCLSKETCKSIDHMLLDDLGKRIRRFYVPSGFPTGTDPNNKWRVVSCLQKAIRHGNTEMAQMSASVLYDLDQSYLFRRLAVIAVEDVGAGSVYSMLSSLAVAGNSAWRKSVDGRRLGVWMAKQQARAPKDRTLCDMLVVVDYEPDLPKAEWAQLPTGDLLAHVDDVGLDFEYRMMAAWLAAGSAKYRGMSMPEDNYRDAGLLFRHMVERGHSRMALYLAAKIAGRLNEAMWVSTLFFDDWLRQTAGAGFDISSLKLKLPPTPKVGQLLGAAYDMYTREGKIAIGKFRKENADVLDPFLKSVPTNMSSTLLSYGIFQVEGGAQGNRAVFANSEPLESRAKVVEMAYTGIDPGLLPEFRQVLLDNIDALNECRAKVLYATRSGS